MPKMMPRDRSRCGPSGRVDGSRGVVVESVVLSAVAMKGVLQSHHGKLAMSARWPCFLGRQVEAATASRYRGRSAGLPIASHVAAWSSSESPRLIQVGLEAEHPIDSTTSPDTRRLLGGTSRRYGNARARERKMWTYYLALLLLGQHYSRR